MATYRTPDVYIEEISVFPPSVAEVETAIPAFIGYTERAVDEAGRSLANQPTLIFSFAEYEQYFGGPATPAIAVALTADGAGDRAAVTPPALTYLMYHAVKMFFDNGGGKCYIVAVGGYADPAAVQIAELQAGLAAVAGLFWGGVAQSKIRGLLFFLYRQMVWRGSNHECFLL